MRSLLVLLVGLSLLGAPAARVNADTDARSDVSHAKQGIKDAGRSIGTAFKKLGHRVGDGVKTSVQTVKGKLHHPAPKSANKPSQ